MLIDFGINGVNNLILWPAILSIMSSFCLFTCLKTKGDELNPFSVIRLIKEKGVKSRHTTIAFLCLLNVSAIGKGIDIMLTGYGVVVNYSKASFIIYTISKMSFLHGLFTIYFDSILEVLKKTQTKLQHQMPRKLTYACCALILLNGIANITSVYLPFLGKTANAILAINTVAISLVLNFSKLNVLQGVFFPVRDKDKTKFKKTLPEEKGDIVRLLFAITKIAFISSMISRHGIRSCLKLGKFTSIALTAWSINDRNASMLKILSSDITKKFDDFQQERSDKFMGKILKLPSMFMTTCVNCMVDEKIRNLDKS